MTNEVMKALAVGTLVTGVSLSFGEGKPTADAIETAAARRFLGNGQPACASHESDGRARSVRPAGRRTGTPVSSGKASSPRVTVKPRLPTRASATDAANPGSPWWTCTAIQNEMFVRSRRRTDGTPGVLRASTRRAEGETRGHRSDGVSSLWRQRGAGGRSPRFGGKGLFSARSDFRHRLRIHSKCGATSVAHEASIAAGSSPRRNAAVIRGLHVGSTPLQP